jgi:hypothetical protein
MAESPQIRWMAKGEGVGGSTLVARTPVTLQTRLRKAPHGFATEEVLPKVLWRRWRTKTVGLDPLDATRVDRSTRNLGALFESSPVWKLPDPRKQTGRTTFQASARPNGEHSGPIHSALLFIEEMDEGYDFAIEPQGQVSPHGIVFKPVGHFARHKRRKWKIRKPDDPQIEVRLLQAGEVFDYIVAIEAELANTFERSAGVADDMPSAARSYFETQLWPTDPIQAFVGPASPVDVEIFLPVQDGLRTAFALEVLDLENRTVSRTEPLFATGLGEDLIISDLPVSLLREEPRELLARLASSGEDLGALADNLGIDIDTAWSYLTDAAEELGVVTVGEAALLVAREMGMGLAGAGGLSPAPA